MSKGIYYSEEFDKGFVKSTGQKCITIYYHGGIVTSETIQDRHRCNNCWKDSRILKDKVLLLTGNYLKIDSRIANQVFQVIELESCREMYLESPLGRIDSIDKFLDYYGFELI